MKKIFIIVLSTILLLNNTLFAATSSVTQDDLKEVQAKLENQFLTYKKEASKLSVYEQLAYWQKLVPEFEVKLASEFGKSGKTLADASIFDIVLNKDILQNYYLYMESSKEYYKLSEKYQWVAQKENKFKLTKTALGNIMKQGYFTGSQSPSIVMIEFGDLECPFCKKFHADKVVETLLQNDKTLSYGFFNFPLSQMHPQAEGAANLLECVGNQLGSEAFFKWLSANYDGNVDTLEANIRKSYSWVKNYSTVDKSIKACASKKQFKTKIALQSKIWTDVFWVSGTPNVVLINTSTLEWVLINGAYPLSTFEEAIKLLK